MSSDGCSPSGAGNVYPFGTAIFVLFLWGSCCSISCFLCSQSKSRPFHVHDLSPESYHEQFQNSIEQHRRKRGKLDTLSIIMNG
jgi:hypothetical protein